MRLDLDRREDGGVGAEEELQQRRGAQLEDRVGRLGAPLIERRPALVGDRVELAPAPAALALLGQIARFGEPLGLAVELGVLGRPEVADRLGDQLLEPVRRGLAGPVDEAEDDEGDGCEAQLLL